MPMVSSERFASIDAEWFWNQVQYGELSECWPWTGEVDDKGYGMVWVATEKGSVRAHRVAYVLGTERPLDPAAPCVLHRCDNPPCCNYQSCLRAGTQAENMVDAARRARIPRKLTTGQLAELRRRYGRGESPESLAAAFNLGARHVRRLAVGDDRKHDDAPIFLPEWRIRGLALPQIKLTDAQVDEIRRTHAEGGVTQRAIAAEYGVSAALICMIVNGKHRSGST